MARYCYNCGNDIYEGDNYCTNCNAKLNQTPTKPSIQFNQNIQGTNIQAIIGLVLSIVGFAFLGLIFSIIGLSNANKLNQNGKGLAIAGIIISILRIILLMFLIIIFLLTASTSNNSFDDTIDNIPAIQETEMYNS